MLVALLVSGYFAPAKAQAPGTPKNEGTQSQQFVSAESIVVAPVTRNPAPGGVNPCSCVSWARYKRPDQDTPWGSPNRVEAYDLTPLPSLLVVTTEGPNGHVAYVERVGEHGLWVSEANYERCKVTTRWIALDAPFIRGYR